MQASEVKISKFKGRLGGRKVETSTPNEDEEPISSNASSSVPSNEYDEEENIAFEGEGANDQQNWTIIRMNKWKKKKQQQ